MGFIKAIFNAASGTFAEQWLEYYVPKQGVSATAAIYPAELVTENNGRLSQNKKGNKNIISNGSRFEVPEGTALVTVQNGEFTNFICEPGRYVFSSDLKASQSIFAGDGIWSSIFKTTWEKVKFGGIPADRQLAFYVNLKEIPNNKFGTQSVIYWDDAYFGTQVGAMTRGTYTILIENPLLFLKNFVPLKYLSENAPVFDFADMNNDAGNQLFTEVVSTLSGAFSQYTNDPSKGNRMAKIQSDQVGFAKSLSQAVEDGYSWSSDRGLTISKVAIVSIEYDETSKALMKEIQRTDALSGARGASYTNLAFADAMKAAGENGGAAGMAFMSMGMQAGQNMMAGMAGMNNQAQQATTPSQEEIIAQLKAKKELLDLGLITQEDYDKLKNKLLGL